MSAPSVDTYRRLSDAGLSTTIKGLMDELEAATAEATRRQAAPESERLKRRQRRTRIDSLGRKWKGHLYLVEGGPS